MVFSTLQTNKLFENGMENRIRILTVEDESNIRRFVKLALENENYEVFEADGVKRGLIEAATVGLIWSFSI